MRLIEICGKKLPVVAQKHAKLRNRLSRSDLESIMTKDYAAQSYRVLGILIPAIPDQIPLWEWEGYLSQEDMEGGIVVDDDGGNSPTTAEMVNAFEAAFLESGADRLGKIIDLGQTVMGMSESQTQIQTPQLPDLPGPTGE